MNSWIAYQSPLPNTEVNFELSEKMNKLTRKGQQGHISVYSGHAAITQFSAQGTGNTDSGVADLGVGSTATATNNEELATTEQNIITKIDTTLNGSGDLSAAVDVINVTPVHLDGSASAAAAYLNSAITATVDGTITIIWALLGDD